MKKDKTVAILALVVSIIACLLNLSPVFHDRALQLLYRIPAWRSDQRAITTSRLSEDFELLGYQGKRIFCDLSHIHLKNDEALYYSSSSEVLKGFGDKQVVISKGWNVENVIKAGGAYSASNLPSKFEYTLFFKYEGTGSSHYIAGRVRMAFYSHHDGDSFTGPGDFKISIPMDAGMIRDNSIMPAQLPIGEKFTVAEYNFIPYDAHGQEDQTNQFTVRWYVIFAVAPKGTRIP